MAERFPEVFATVGFHPQEAGLLDDEGRAGHRRAGAASRGWWRVGETGLDFYHDNWPHDVQEDVFVYHLDLARRAGLPVVIHTRDAADRTLAVLAEHAADLTVILHCFSLPDRLDEVVDRGYYVSFAGNVTYKNAARSAGRGRRGARRPAASRDRRALADAGAASRPAQPAGAGGRTPTTSWPGCAGSSVEAARGPGGGQRPAGLSADWRPRAAARGSD